MWTSLIRDKENYLSESNSRGWNGTYKWPWFNSTKEEAENVNTKETKPFRNERILGEEILDSVRHILGLRAGHLIKLKEINNW